MNEQLISITNYEVDPATAICIRFLFASLSSHSPISPLISSPVLSKLSSSTSSTCSSFPSNLLSYCDSGLGSTYLIPRGQSLLCD